ncbi:MAG: hypothetical protein R6V58_16355 [Planctomycetota bacterium]
MANLRESTRRVLATYGIGTADRIPISSPIRWRPTDDIDESRPDDWRGEPDEIEAKVRRAIDEAGTERTFLYPSAGPHQRHSERFTANAGRSTRPG